MRLRKLLAGVGVLCLCAVLFMPVQAQAAEQSNGTVTITTEIPDTHTATLLIDGKGTVAVDKETYTAQRQDIRLPRLEETVWVFSPADGYELERVLYNGSNVTSELEDSSYTADGVYEDGTTVEVTFKKGSGSSGTGTGSGTGGHQSSGTGNRQT